MGRFYAIEGLRPVVHPTAFVHPDAVLIGDVIVGPGVYIAPHASLRGDMGRISVGAVANVQDCCVLHSFPGAQCTVEPWGHIGHAAVLHGCTIGRNALVGMNALVMDGAVVGENAIVAAMAFVSAGFEVPPQTLVAGVPAKVKRELSDEDVAWKRRGTEEYQRLARRSAASLEPCEALVEIEPDRPALRIEPHQPLHIAKKARR